MPVLQVCLRRSLLQPGVRGIMLQGRDTYLYGFIFKRKTDAKEEHCSPDSIDVGVTDHASLMNSQVLWTVRCRSARQCSDRSTMMIILRSRCQSAFGACPFIDQVEIAELIYGYRHTVYLFIYLMKPDSYH